MRTQLPAAARTEESNRSMLRVGFVVGLLGAIAFIVQAIVQSITVAQNVAIPLTVRGWSSSGPTVPTVDPAAAGDASAVAVSSVIDLQVSDVSAGPQSLLIIGILISALSVAIATACVSLLTRSIGRGEPFGRSANRAFTISSTAILLGTTIGLTIRIFAEREIIAEIFGAGHGAGERLGVVSTTTTDFTLIFVGLALLVVGIAFRAGEKMQHDTKGLV